MEGLVGRLHKVFVENNYEWKFADGMKVPDQDDLKYVLDSMRDALLSLDDDGSQPQVELGRLIMKRREGHYDVFVFTGEYNENS